ncbi:MAG: nicotinate (nicotinamide) nucleotide adenylyltransferase [Lentimicrobium sp.]|jgi:nicotinate-nucleotide adenylyltransferase|uniref:nicotinate (nicotinamide) nucleotide adenylyltransferase n=1 Tax=Lentimicrobium sp. TaxID=2034841 RepID=UPI0025E27497|nr:nicotinate (nicotinamide) nucleotide adenylyltransferase [Lentimicrobium sp.]MCO5257892.1 nicotinate (nicotinamide) nucleotide adenylyltransferase [Lentimicrobium sp.]MCO5262170.1 nicotinate (nicotinamide) nucleotide adenylyltransferase [Lentimicrobium sp.]HOP14107.1 nicotinate (nicotinamide) nucleotide adenylyltransferase [Lentimicrobium sp.]HPF63364.1 nicotinate (nicotinamide) nucleotide adenylyltransferase [Lentimicrobium sp.]HPJ63121.1 nicotinate (nicotinamide) nucleotide adenylyltransf
MNKPEKPTPSKLTGLFFGSFNPIHFGHLCIAEFLVEFGGLKEVWFIVSPHNPLKDKATLLSDQYRLEMVEAAIENDERFRVSDIEFRMPRPSYTIDTLARLSEQHPDRQFVLIAGTDVLPSFHKWKNYEQLLDQYRLMIYPRHGDEDHPLLSHPSITVVNAPRIEISASFIREAIKNGKNIRYFLPDKVMKIIEKMGFYLR